MNIKYLSRKTGIINETIKKSSNGTKNHPVIINCDVLIFFLIIP
jgi:hypothetical protein